MAYQDYKHKVVSRLGLQSLPFIAGLMLIGSLAGCSPSSQFSAFSSRIATLPEQLMPAEDAAQVAMQDNNAADDDIERPQVEVLAYAAPEKPSASRAHIDGLINKYAILYNVPVSLVHRVVNRESTYNPLARNGIHRGLMQLNPTTARTMGFRGNNADLHDPDTNLRYGVKYLAGAWLVAKGNADRADKYYQTGYYYRAKRMGLLKATGLRP